MWLRLISSIASALLLPNRKFIWRQGFRENGDETRVKKYLDSTSSFDKRHCPRFQTVKRCMPEKSLGGY